jgi:decaprenylphospho-beta-D-ribofuranose 2-oxidase
MPPEVRTFRSFDGGVVERARTCRPDRRALLEKDLGPGPRIARGGGYSYAAASFGGDALVLDVTRLDRVLRFEPDDRRVEVEAGVTLGALLAATAPHALWLPVQPGYPAITVGGCIAANVHGKNPWREGTFRRSVVDLTLAHPRLGTVRIAPETHPDLFDLTCGGYGLTGIVLAATLRLEPLPGPVASVERVPVASLADGLARLRELTEPSAFAYSWHDGAPSRFGRGFVYACEIPAGPPPRWSEPPRYRRLTAARRAALPVSLWGRATARLLGAGFRAAQALRPARTATPLFDALFPFARRGEYLLLYGRRGLAEYQVLVPDASADGFLREVEREVLRARPPVMLSSMKLFRGEPGGLRFEGDGVCFTMDLARSRDALEFLPVLDRLTLAAGGLPHIVKDSRLPADVVARSYPGYEGFRERLRAHDPERLFRSELSARLAL